MPMKRRKTEKAIKSKILNFKVTQEEYDRVKEISQKLGVTTSSMLNIILHNQLSKVDKTGDPSAFLKK